MQEAAVKEGYVELINDAMGKAVEFGKNLNKKSMMLVQLTGALRNLVGE